MKHALHALKIAPGSASTKGVVECRVPDRVTAYLALSAAKRLCLVVTNVPESAAKCVQKDTAKNAQDERKRGWIYLR